MPNPAISSGALLKKHLVKFAFGTSVAALALSFQAAGYSAIAQTEEAGDDQPIDRIVTIGTRVAGRTATETTVAIDIIGAEQISRNTGLFEVGELLQRLAPSFNFSRTQISDGSDIFRPATLRGLGPDQVLVLINGKRRHSRALLGLAGTVGEGSAGVDLNAIPSIALQQIEILRDGAAAQYGSDAIAGVINLRLKDSVNEFSGNVMAGQTYQGDGERYQVQLNGGLALGEAGFLNLSAEYRNGDTTNRAADSPQFPGTQIFRQGDADTEFFSLFANAGVELGESAELYAFGGYSNSDAVGAGFFRFNDEADRAVPQVFPNGFLPRATNESEDFSFAVGARGDLNDTWGFDVSIVHGKNDYDFGARNTVNASIAADFLNRNPGASDAEIAANAGPMEGFSGSQAFRQTTFNADINGEIDVNLASPLFVAFGFEFRDEEYNIVPGQLESFSCGLSPDNAFIPSILDPGAGVDPVTFEPIDQATGTPATCGFQAFPGFRPESAGNFSRDNYAIYIDMETNLTDRLLVGLAGRFEDYGSIGDKFTGKASARYEFADNFAIRGAVQNGFRAPSLQQLSLEFVTTNVGADGLTETLLARSGSEFPGFFGIDGLKIETSTSFSAGFVWEPLDNLTLTVDGFLINIDDRIVLGNPLVAAQLDDFPGAQAFLNDNLIAQANFFSNGVDTKTRGIDIVVNHNTFVMEGTLNTTLAVNLNRTTIKRINAPAGIDPDIIFPDPSQRFLETGQPRERVNLSFDWARDQFSSLLRVNYIGGTKTSFFTEQGLGIPAGAPFNNETVLKPGDGFLVDLEFAYQVTDNVEFAIGANNLLDTKPNKVAPDSVIAGISRGNLQFPMRGLAYGLNGGFYYARAAVTF